MIDRVGESRSNNELAAELARRLGYDLTRFDVDRAAILERCAPRRRQLRRRPRDAPAPAARSSSATPRRRTPTGAPTSRRCRTSACPRYVELDDPYPLTLITPATAKTINSMFGEFQPADPAVHLHPDDAAARGLADGDAVVVRNDRATVPTTRADRRRAAARASSSMPKGSWCRDFAGGLTAERADAGHALGPRRRRVLQRHARRGRRGDLTGVRRGRRARRVRGG